MDIGAAIKAHAGEEDRGDEDVLVMYSVKNQKCRRTNNREGKEEDHLKGSWM